MAEPDIAKNVNSVVNVNHANNVNSVNSIRGALRFVKKKLSKLSKNNYTISSHIFIVSSSYHPGSYQMVVVVEWKWKGEGCGRWNVERS